MDVLTKKDLLYPKLSYKIVGVLFDVYNELGYGYREKYYEEAVSKAFEGMGIEYIRQLHTPLKYKNKEIGKYFLDFLVEDKIVLEIKQGSRLTKKSIQQVFEYLKSNNLKLGIIAQFTPSGLKFKRVVNEL